MRADMHTHSHFSFDGRPESTVAALCEAAIEKGLSHLAITDHCDINGEIEGLYAVLDKEAVFAAVAEAKQAYADKLTVLFGLELGQPTQYPTEARALLERYPYDIVLGSLHNLANEKDFFYFDFSQMPDDKVAAYFNRVLDESMALCDFDGIHVLTHLTYMHRYLRRAGRDMDFAPFREKLCALFQKMITRGIALELNVSTLARAGISMPTPEILSLYRQCGGKLISLGSDAHAPDRVAQHFDAAASILSACGFCELAIPTAHGVLTFPIEGGTK